jgi:hypothetical protein
MAQPVKKIAGGRIRVRTDREHTPGLPFGPVEPSADHGTAALTQGFKIAIQGYG